jgi:ABC-type transporter Mla subunit MlaD
MKSRGIKYIEVFDNPILVGTVTILVVIVAVYLSYVAENGLPYVPRYNVNIDVASAAQLVKNAPVRIGSDQVGQVLTITPEPASADTSGANKHPFARLGLALETSVGPLPVDTRYEVRLGSVLGGKYVSLVPGNPHSGTVPDGGTLPLSDNIPFVDLDTAFDVFGPRTQFGLRHVIKEFGDATAGRGTAFNAATYSLAHLLGPLNTVLAVFAARDTNLAGFIDGVAATASALEVVTPQLNDALVKGTATFNALNAASTSLGNTIDQAPATESLGTTVLTNATPVLANAAAITQALKPAAALLPLASERVDAIVTSATPVFRKVPELATTLDSAVAAIGKLARDPNSVDAFKLLGTNDLATFGASAFVGLGAILRDVAPAQLACNTAAIWARNFASVLSEGDATGSWLRAGLVVNEPQLFEASTTAGNLHYNYYPNENAHECEAGNEPYSPGQLIGNPPGNQSTKVDNTSPPPGVLARAAAAGLLGSNP